MFEGNKYITRGVKEEIDESIQIALWMMIDELKNKQDFKIDYLQVYDLKVIKSEEKILQQITHHQEVEYYSNTRVFEVPKPLNAKIFVISSVDENRKEYSVMMFAEEY